MFSIRNPLALIREYRSSSGLAVPQDWFSDALTGPTTMAGENVSVLSSLQIADVFAAINLIAEEIGKLPCKVYRDQDATPGNPNEGIDEAETHRMWPLLHDKPNPWTPANRFWSTVAVHQLGWGNWYIEKLRDPASGLVNELRLIHPSKVQLYWNEAAGAKAFLVTRQLGKEEWKYADDVLHGFGVSNDGIVGLSPIQQSREALGVVQARTRFEADAYGNHPYASAALLHPGTVKDAQRIRESWRAIYGSGSKERGNVAVLEEGTTIQQLAMPMADLQFVESTQMSKSTIAAIFKLPPSYISGSIGDSLTYQTVESNKIWLATQTLAPIVANIASFINSDPSLFPFGSWFCAFDLNELMRGDSLSRIKYWTGMLEMQCVTPAYICEREGLPPPPEPRPIEPIPPGLQPNVLAKPQTTPADRVLAPATNGKSAEASATNGTMSGA